MVVDGSFFDELSRIKFYNYILFNLEGYVVLCCIVFMEDENLWVYEGVIGSLEKVWVFMFLYIKDKFEWIKLLDVEYFDELLI